MCVFFHVKSELRVLIPGIRRRFLRYGRVRDVDSHLPCQSSGSAEDCDRRAVRQQRDLQQHRKVKHKCRNAQFKLWSKNTTATVIFCLSPPLIQSYLRGNHVHHGPVGCAHRGSHHAPMPEEDRACRPPRVRRQHVGIGHLYLPYFRRGQEEHHWSLCKSHMELAGQTFICLSTSEKIDRYPKRRNP